MAKHYVQLNDKNEIIAGYSDEFSIEVPLSELTLINKEGGRHFEIEGSSNLFTENQIPLYKFTNGKVVKKNSDELQLELNTLTFNQLLQNKLEELNLSCQSIIYAGTDVKTSQGIKHFSLTVDDQNNLNALVSQVIASGGNSELEITYHADGEKCRKWNLEDFMNISTKLTEFKTYHITYCNFLKLHVKSLKSIEELEKVYYGMELPKKDTKEINNLLGIK